ncbi:MAG: phosphatidylinositol mannoside acyltransferase [Acidimicrobiales bacterium]|nr:phosphatidylinositol mannoside acyltransferase [Acidimicrobiales bacterium]
MQALPRPVALALATLGGWASCLVMAEGRFLVSRNLQRIAGGTLGPWQLRRQVLSSFAHYSRYWVESARLPKTPDDEVDEGHDVVGYEHVQRALDAGTGIILVLPHLGGWEWSAFWLARINNVRVTAVVEPLQPPAVMEWFMSFRRSLGMNIVPLGPTAGQEVLAALKRNDVVCLLADRDVNGAGIDVTFFGEKTTMPGGPATLALRSGAPLCPTAVYFDGRYGHRGVVRPPLDATRTGRLRADVHRLTQQVADELEELIRAAPEQWHLMQPNWPSDEVALADRRLRRER